jgi:hypothetical protein
MTAEAFSPMQGNFQVMQKQAHELNKEKKDDLIEGGTRSVFSGMMARPMGPGLYDAGDEELEQIMAESQREDAANRERELRDFMANFA